MEKKNLIQRIGTNIGSFLLGVALASGINYVAKEQPVSQPTEQVQHIGYWDYNMSNWIPPEAAVYRVHREYDGRLNHGYVEVDKNGDGEYDQIVKFWHKTPLKENPKAEMPSTIELYERVTIGTRELLLGIEGFPAYNVIGRLVKKYTAERGISNEEYKNKSQRFFKENGLDARVLQNEFF